jgi:hypothetical protein
VVYRQDISLRDNSTQQGWRMARDYHLQPKRKHSAITFFAPFVTVPGAANSNDGVGGDPKPGACLRTLYSRAKF